VILGVGDEIHITVPTGLVELRTLFEPH